MGGLGAGAAGAGGAPLGTAGDSATKTKSSGTSQRMGGEDMGMGHGTLVPLVKVEHDGAAREERYYNTGKDGVYQQLVHREPGF